MALDEDIAVEWLIGGLIVGIALGLAWWLWVRGHGIRALNPKHRSLWIAWGLLGALLIGAPPEPIRVFVFAVGTGSSLVTAFPPKEAHVR